MKILLIIKLWNQKRKKAKSNRGKIRGYQIWYQKVNLALSNPQIPNPRSTIAFKFPSTGPLNIKCLNDLLDITIILQQKIEISLFSY